MAQIDASTQTPLTGCKATCAETNSFEITLLLQNKRTIANIQVFKKYRAMLKWRANMETNALYAYIHTLRTILTVRPINCIYCDLGSFCVHKIAA